MRYLKLFEDYSSDQILDCFMDLVDNDFEVVVQTHQIFIEKNSDVVAKPFKFDDVKETLLFAIPYLDDEYGIEFPLQ